MKKSRLLLAGSFLLTATFMNAQVTRTCLAEGFSNASCGPCASQNPAYGTFLSSNSSKVIGIKYQTNWPGTDPMNAQTQSQVGPRVSYYGVTGVPWGCLDGTAYAGPSYSGALANLDQTELDTRQGMTSPFNLTVTHTLSPDFDSIFVTVNANTPGAFSGTTMKLHVLMVEQEIVFSSAPGSNGETEFKNVFRDSYTTTAGQNISNTWTASQSDQWTFAEPIPAYIYDLSKVAVVAFIQDDASNEVHQAALSNPVALPNYAVTENIGNVAALSCVGDLNSVTIDINNIGANTLSSATVHYQIDAGTPMTAPFTGSVAPSNTSPFTLPNITGVANGEHTLTTWLTDINGSGSTSPVGTATKTFTIVSAAGTTSPVQQDFSTGTIPYTNWVLDNPGSETWRRVTNAGGVALFQCYAYANGTESGMILEPMDMTAMGNASLTFDVAYRQYTSENDQLEVFVSTDCGANWTSVYNKAGSTLATLTPSTTQFIPSGSGDWRLETIDLSAYASANKLFIKFQGTSNYGNNIFVDNINVSASSSIDENNGVELNVYPNPTADVLNINLDLATSSDVTLSLANSLGQTVMVRNLGELNGSTINTLDVSSLAAGVYTININVNGSVTVKQFIKN